MAALAGGARCRHLAWIDRVTPTGTITKGPCAMAGRKSTPKSGNATRAESRTNRRTPGPTVPAGSTTGRGGKPDIGKIRELLASRTQDRIALALSLLPALKAGDGPWMEVFRPSVLKTLAESWDVRTWQAVSERLGDLPALRASLEASIVSQFRKLTKLRQTSVLEGAIEDMRPELVPLFKELVAVVNGRSHRDDDLLFSQVRRMPDAAAEVLAGYCREVSLPRLGTLSDTAAAWLGSCENGYGLALGGLTSISDKAAAALATFKGNCLSLSGLASLTDGSSKALAAFAGAVSLRLGGLRSISDTAAAHLARYRGQRLDLSGLQTVSDAAAARLATYRGDELDLSGLRTISDKALEALANGRMQTVRLDGLRTISERAARILEKRNEGDVHVTLDGLTGRMSGTTAEALVRGGYSLAPPDGISPPRIEIVFAGPITIDMTRAGSIRGGGLRRAAAKPAGFWRISLEGKSCTVTEGRIGTTGHSTRKTFDSPKSALKSFTKAIWKKELEGFGIVASKDR